MLESTASSLSIRTFLVSFHLGLLLCTNALGSWSSQLEASLAAMEGDLDRCISDRLACRDSSHRNWIEIRWSGSTRVVQRLDAAAGEEQDLIGRVSRLARANVPRPDRVGELRTWVLGRRQGWDAARVLMEKSVSQERSLALLVDLHSELKGLPVDPLKRFWVFTADGEVIHQSEGQFIGSVFNQAEHFNNPSSQYSFDAMPVQPRWVRHSDSLAPGWLTLEETLVVGPRTPSFRDRLSAWINTGLARSGLFLFKALFVAALAVGPLLLFLKRRRPAGLVQQAVPPAAPPAMPVRPAEPKALVPEVVVPQIVQARPVDTKEIYGARTFHDLGCRLMALVAREAQSPVLFLEYNREIGMSVYRGQHGLTAAQSPVSLRVAMSDHPGHLHEQPALQNVLLQRMGISHFEVLEVRSAGAGQVAGSRLPPRLLGLLVILQPGVKSFENRPYFERLLEEAGRYHDSIIRPAPPRLPQQRQRPLEL